MAGQLHYASEAATTLVPFHRDESSPRRDDLRAYRPPPLLRLHGVLVGQVGRSGEGRHEAQRRPGLHLGGNPMAHHSGGQLPIRPRLLSASLRQLLLLARQLLPLVGRAAGRGPPVEGLVQLALV